MALNLSAATVMLPGRGMEVAAGITWKVEVVTVKGLMGSLNPIRTTVLVPTPVAPLAGSTTVTLGGVRSAVVPVWKVKLPGLSSGLPARSVIAVLSTTVYGVVG